MSPFGKVVTTMIAFVTGTLLLTGLATAYMLRPTGSADTMTATYATPPVRRVPAVVAPRLASTVGRPTSSRFAGLNGTSPKHQIKTLQGIAQEGGYQLDVSGIEKQTPTLYMDAAVNSMLANDLLAQRGVDVSGLQGTATYRNMATENPMGLLDLLGQQAGVNMRRDISAFPTQYNADGQMVTIDPSTGQSIDPGQPGWRTDVSPQDIAELQTPGRATRAVIKIFSRLNPNFAQTPLGQKFASLAAVASAASYDPSKVRQLLQARP